jgi:glucosamine 6-phosphate synthetase-like amidotransferase/phosphosugar isomerase protein|tara:strand:+ start:202 stop:852 length:651 start_codon:yes stop_codon:yes gene_type:complete
MCGIFGSTDWERFTTLYKLNKDRGSFAYGGMYLYEQGPRVQKAPGDSFQLIGPGCDSGQYYMGHTQAPTSAQREFDPKTSHPFQFEHWRVAHNGVLSNSRVLAEEYEVDSPVDSAIIPKLLSIKELDSKNEVNAIEQACSELEGTFACWIYNEMSEQAYLVRCGSTLFANNEGEFSSTETGSMHSLKEGVIYCIDYAHNFIYPLSKFRCSSPFFIL